jgi:hypothetical protein
VKPGDLIKVYASGHSYPAGWVRGQEPYRYHLDTPVIFLGIHDTSESDPRVFWDIIAPTGIHTIFSGYCSEVIS